MLYYIVSLHQTTTARAAQEEQDSCIISFLYIKPQLTRIGIALAMRCIISFLYIKPQLLNEDEYDAKELYYIVSLHQTTTQPYSF